jgi:hypothetical protein
LIVLCSETHTNAKLESSANSTTINTIIRVFDALKAEIILNAKIEERVLNSHNRRAIQQVQLKV